MHAFALSRWGRLPWNDLLNGCLERLHAGRDHEQSCFDGVEKDRPYRQLFGVKDFDETGARGVLSC